ncbi:MAG: hypothetical protein WC306_00890 [Candidatus Paceibacterota bacterium]|jgi:hypothetical protein
MKNIKKKKVVDIYPPHTLEKKPPIDEKKSKEKESVQYLEKEEDIMIRIESTSLSQENSRLIEEEPEIINLEEEKIIEKPEVYEESFQSEKTGIKTKRNKFLSIVLPLVFISFLYYLGFVVLIKAEVLITSKKLILSLDNDQVLIDKNIAGANYSQKVIPGNLFIFPENNETEFKSTGQGKDEQKAKGIITIINKFSSTPQILVANTRFEAPDGKIFRLDSRIVIPGTTMKDGKLEPSSIDVNVTADKSGPEYNIPACNNNCKFTIPGFKGTIKFDGFYGISNKEMAGGSLSSVPMVTAEDLKNAEDSILKVINNKISEDLKNQIPNNLKILDGAKSGIKIVKISSDASAGDFRQSFTVTATGEVRAIAFREQDLIELIRSQFDAQKPEKYDYCGNPTIEYKDIKPDFEKGTLKLIISIKQTICYHLSQDEIKKDIAGKNKKELEIILKSMDGIEEVKVNLFPLWLKKVPMNLNKIKVSIDLPLETD